MPDISTFVVVALASLALTLTPGPAVLYIVARGVEGGRAAGFVSAFGIAAGGLIHILFAAVGLSALLASSATAFSVVKWLGVAYLIWLGLSRWFGKDNHIVPASTERRNLPGVFWQGVIIDNPKPQSRPVLSRLPAPVRGPGDRRGVVADTVARPDLLVRWTMYRQPLRLALWTAGGWLRRRYESASFRRGQRYFSGSIYLALGAATAISGPARKE